MFTGMIETSILSITVIADGEMVSMRGRMLLPLSVSRQSITVILCPLIGINLIESDINRIGNLKLVEQTPAEEKQLEKVSLQ